MSTVGRIREKRCDWEGNRRSDVALAMRHRLQYFIHLRDHGLRKEMSTHMHFSSDIIIIINVIMIYSHQEMHIKSANISI